MRIVDHNLERIPKASSYIFMHIKKPSGKPTVGCTAMAKSEIREIIEWLDPSKKPLLIKAPRSEIDKLFKG